MPLVKAHVPLRLITCGDSTQEPQIDDSGLQGWVRYLWRQLSSSAHVYNGGSSGKSSTTYRSSGLWTTAQNQRGNVYIMQFGANDSHEGEPEYADPDTTYRDALAQYIAEGQAQGAEVWIATPCSRNTWTTIYEPAKELQPWVSAAIAEAAEQGVQCLDVANAMFAAMRELTLPGMTAAGYYYDTTHFTEAGAAWVAGIVRALLLDTSLAPYVV